MLLGTKKTMARYSRYKTLDIDTVIDAIRNNKQIHDTKDSGLSSLRLKTFAEKGVCCAYCGLGASYFAVEKCQGSKSDKHHLNLWGVKNKQEILFTHDHVHARSLGGADEIENSVTACEKCNSKKSKYENQLKHMLNANKVSVDFGGLVDMVKSIYRQPHILKFWFIEEV
jgi:hypothetical protein